MDVVSAKVLGTGAFVFGLIFITTSAVRLSRADLDIVVVLRSSRSEARPVADPHRDVGRVVPRVT
jgi:hypothetical protein